MADSFLTRISGPAVPLLSLAEAKAFDCCNVQHDDDDAAIAALVEEATETVDAEWGELGRALITQRWQLTLPAFPASGVIILPMPPVQEVTGVTYYDADNAQQTLASNTYRLTANGENARLDKVSGVSWPATYARADAVAVQYDAGYGDAAADVPAGIRGAVKALVGHWYNYGKAASEKSMSEVPFGIRSMLHKYRVIRGHI